MYLIPTSHMLCDSVSIAYGKRFSVRKKVNQIQKEEKENST